MTKSVTILSPQSDESTTTSAGRYRERQNSACVCWLQATPKANLAIIDIICRNLVLLRSKSLVRSRRTVRDLGPAWMVRSSRHRIKTDCFPKHKGVLILSRLRERMLKLVAKTQGTGALAL